ncbi:hypothetical protein B296_00020114 [Ensete ventricosum]|uniref:Uncharacterized protein n=1 Tax=Ensete ventricosum TaxID=4639 RepID=A0A427AP35_ENSVE|nr:hypothetical protein B296_00020114 [Ensete ventricosum]
MHRGSPGMHRGSPEDDRDLSRVRRKLPGRSLGPLGWNLPKYPSRIRGVDREDEIWSISTELSFDRDQGHELSQRQEWDHVVPLVLHSDRAYSSCMVPKTKGASRHMHLISKMYLIEKLSPMEETLSYRGMIRVTGELDCSSANIRLRESDKSEDKAEGETFVQLSIPCSHGGRALVVKGAEEVENADANSKYQDRVEGQRPRNFIRPVSMGFSSR